MRTRSQTLKVRFALCLASLTAAAAGLCRAAVTEFSSYRAPGTALEADPWTRAQTVEPAALAKEISSRPTARPTTVCIGFHTLYEGAHVPAAFFHGPASTPDGVAELRRWAQALPRSTNVVIYCGCCPLAHCPNVRPAFTVLRQMGFIHVRVLLIPNDFAHDWVQPGYPVAKGK
jgi:thiosulfate/3-mercaptopyruvate sulfurtransferase